MTSLLRGAGETPRAPCSGESPWKGGWRPRLPRRRRPALLLVSSGSQVQGCSGQSRAASRATPQWSGWDLTSGEAFISRESCEAPGMFGNHWSEGPPPSAPQCALVQRLGPHLEQPLAGATLRCLSTVTGPAVFTPPQASSAQAHCLARPVPLRHWPAAHGLQPGRPRPAGV